jgi:Glycoside-hydrolase family GH114
VAQNPCDGDEETSVRCRLACLAATAALLLAPAAPAGSAGRADPPPGAGFSYQIGGPFRPAPGVAIVDRDWHVRPASGTYGICYLNAFQAQTGEHSWWLRRHPSLLLRRAGRPVVDTSWNEQLFDTSTPGKRRALAAVIDRWIDRCARVGYRAVEPDNLDSWTRSHGALTVSDNFALARLLIRHAHADGLAIAQKNAAELSGRGRRLGFDFAIAEECQTYRECGSYLRAYGDEVIEIEYTDGGLRNFERACALRGSRISIVYRDRNVTPAGHAGFVERRCG